MALSLSGLAGTVAIPSGGFTATNRSIGASSAQSTGYNQATNQAQSSTYIPDYSQTPILNEIAQYSRQMAPQVYQWGMDQYSKNQGNIDAMMRNALSYASPQRIASEMGRAEAGVQQGAEAGRQNAIRDLQSYGIDPSSGRYAALDKANQVMAGAAAAGAGNQQREATTATGTQMAQAAQGLSEQNFQQGYGASNAMNQLLGTGMQLKYSPLGTVSSSSGQSSGSTQSTNESLNLGAPQNTGGGSAQGTHLMGQSGPGMTGPGNYWLAAKGGSAPDQTGYGGGDEATTGGFVSQELSPSGGAATDDVQARLNSGEFVIPKDVAAWKGQEFFYKLMAQARTMRATAGSEQQQPQLGYGAS